MHELAYFDPNERTEFSDDNYAVVGRALTYATHFEDGCKVLATYIYAREKVHLIDKEDEFTQFINDLRIRLKQSIDKFTSTVIKGLQQGNMSHDIKDTLHDTVFTWLDEGRKARNFVAHELAIGLVHYAESDDFRQTIIPLIKEKIEQIAKADFFVCGFLENVINKRNLCPNLEDYINRVTIWICEVDD